MKKSVLLHFLIAVFVSLPTAFAQPGTKAQSDLKAQSGIMCELKMKMIAGVTESEKVPVDILNKRLVSEAFAYERIAKKIADHPTGIAAAKKADAILKEKGVVGVLVGSLGMQVWGRFGYEGPHSPAVVAVLNTDKNFEKNEGGIVWFQQTANRWYRIRTGLQEGGFLAGQYFRAVSDEAEALPFKVTYPKVADLKPGLYALPSDEFVEAHYDVAEEIRRRMGVQASCSGEEASKLLRAAIRGNSHSGGRHPKIIAPLRELIPVLPKSVAKDGLFYPITSDVQSKVRENAPEEYPSEY